jgi:hypothetical protein
MCSEYRLLRKKIFHVLYFKYFEVNPVNDSLIMSISSTNSSHEHMLLKWNFK